MSARLRRAALAVGLAFLLAGTVADHSSISAQGNRAERGDRDRGNDQGIDRRMSGAGRLAALGASGKLDKMIARARAARAKKDDGDISAKEIDDGRDGAEGPEDEGPTGGQAETSIAVDSTGQHVVVGVNDTRGFALSPLSVSGFAYSDDGGATFTDGGQLPVNVGAFTFQGTQYPQVWGDPEVKYLGGSNFIYFSIVVGQWPATGTPTGTIQTMGFHRSTDYGHTWQGPFIVSPASGPHGLISEAADKEFADVDLETGRVIMTWSNFTSAVYAPGGVEISSTYSDNVMAATPAWSARSIIAATSTDGQMSIPRFAGNATPGKGSSNVYVAWARFTSNSFRNIGFARSTNNGASFSAPVNIASDFLLSDEALGNDRSNNAPSLAVDRSGGAFHGNVYVTYENNNNLDGGDVVFQRSTDQGVTFSSPIRLNSRPSPTPASADRSQWFPWVTVDKTTGRVYVVFYDQGVAADGDLTETTYVYSDNGGVTWSKPMPLSDRPFHAGYGNDTGQPNIGDYIQAVAQDGALSGAWAGTPPLVGFADGEPASKSMTVPDMYYRRATTPRISAALGAVSFTDSGPGPLGTNGSVDPGEQVSFTLPLRNYVTNPLMTSTLTGVSATLSTSTPGVLVTQSGSAYSNLAGGTAYTNNASPFVAAIGSTFTPGTYIDFVLTVTSAQGTTSLPFMVATGSPLATTLLSENFNGGIPFTWTQVHVGGNNQIPWTIRDKSIGPAPAPLGTGNLALFHANANDGLANTHTRWERLLSSTFNVPASAEYVTVDFDLQYDLEEEPSMNVQAYDGLVLRVNDITAGRITRFVAAEAFAEQFTTGTSNFYPRRLLRTDLAGYFQDLSAWSGTSSGFKHVHLKLPGMAGSSAQLSFEYTQDNSFTCTSPRPGDTCGVLVDNLVVQSVVSKKPTNVTLTSSVNPSSPGQNVMFTATVTASDGTFATDGTVTFKEGATILSGPTTLVNGQATFNTSSLPAGNHTITAWYTSTTGNFADGNTSIVQQVAVTINISINDVSLPEGASGIQAATFTVSLSPASASTVTVQYATADGTATLADFDYAAASGTLTFTPGQVSKPVTVSVFGDSRFEPDETFAVNLSNPSNAVLTDSQGIGTILNDDPSGPAVDDTTVNQAIVSGAERLRLLQHGDGGWSYYAPDNNCHPTVVSCPNTIGVTALALLAAYQRTSTQIYLDAAKVAGDNIVNQFNSTQNPGLPHTQDVEFLAELGQITGNTTYSNTANAWFQVVKNTYATPAANVDRWLLDRQDGTISSNRRSLAAWDLASLIRTAKAAGDVQYALGLATRIVEQETLWKDETRAHRFDQCGHPADGCGPDPTNPFAFDFTLVGEGSLLWAFHDLPGFDAQINAYRAFLLEQQDPAGSWDVGDSQVTAYAVLGLAAVGGAQAEAAIRSALAFFLSTQNAQGGWPSYVSMGGNGTEITEDDSEIVRALFTLFNTPSGSSITVAPAQLSSVTFANVTSPGMTSVFGVDPSRLPSLPRSYFLLDGLAYEVTTTAAIAGNITVCFNVPWVADVDTFEQVRILQVSDGAFVDRTVLAPASPAPDFDRRQLCARTSSLDPFAIATATPDIRPPTISVTLRPAAIWPPNGKMVTVEAKVIVGDDIDLAPRVELLSIEGNDARGRGTDIAGAAIGTDDFQFSVRASPNADYTVSYRAIDAAGNAADAVATVQVGR